MSPSERAQADAKRYAVRFRGDPATQQVAPRLPNSFDATQGGRLDVGSAGYKANNRGMYELNPVGRAVERGWQSPTAGDAGSIASRYGGGSVPPLRGGQSGLAGRPASVSGSTSSVPDNSQVFSSIANSPQPSATGAAGSGAGVPPPAQNAQQRWSGQKENWMASGGSERTWNKAGVALGIRPRIDARGTQSPNNSVTNPVAFKTPAGFASDVGTGAPVSFGDKSTMTQSAPTDMRLPY